MRVFLVRVLEKGSKTPLLKSFFVKGDLKKLELENAYVKLEKGLEVEGLDGIFGDFGNEWVCYKKEEIGKTVTFTDVEGDALLEAFGLFVLACKTVSAKDINISPKMLRDEKGYMFLVDKQRDLINIGSILSTIVTDFGLRMVLNRDNTIELSTSDFCISIGVRAREGYEDVVIADERFGFITEVRKQKKRKVVRLN